MSVQGEAGPLRIGIVGLGKIARDQHLPAIAVTPGLELCAVADPMATHSRLPSYPDIAAMLAGEPALGAVVLCQPPRFRAEAARQAILAGKHVFMEKPPGVCVGEADELCALAAQHGVTLFAAWHSRKAPGVAAAKAWLADRKIISVAITWKEDVCQWHPGQQWIWEEGGFGVFDPGINALSILTEIMPGRMIVTAAQLFVPANCVTPIAAEMAIRTSSGIPVAAEFDFRQRGQQTWDIRIESNAGTLLLQAGGAELSVEGRRFALPEEAEYSALYHHFMTLVEQGESDVDLAPLQLIAEATTGGQVHVVEPFRPW